MNGPAPYLDENLQMDYNRLEAKRCYCTAEKAVGASMCERCLAELAPGVRTSLLALRPGDGIAAAADIAWNEMNRKKKGWRK